MEFQGENGISTTEFPVEICIPGIIVREDGTIDRSKFDTFVPASEDELLQGVATKDVVIDHQLGTWVRIFLPKATETPSEQQQQQKKQKIPIILYFHAGGFVILSAASKPFHELCCNIASKAQVLVVSVEYRKAPEHRLPSAFQDAATALKWLQAQASAAADNNVNGHVAVEPWLFEYGDFSACFLMGHSAGANIVHDLAYRCSKGVDGLGFSAPLKVRGIISCIPGFGGSQKKRSEIEYAERDLLLNLRCLYSFWTLALPQGSDLDHPYANFQSSESPKWENVRVPPIMMVVGEYDLMLDRQVEFAQMLRDCGINVTLVECKGRSHSDFLFPEIPGQDSETDDAYLQLREFMCSTAHVDV